MRTIRIDEDVWNAIESEAVGFGDTPNSVLRRKYGLDGRQPPRAPLRPKEKTPQRDYRAPILEALREMGGKGAKDDVLSAVEKKMMLKPADYEVLSSGEVRWRKSAQWERHVMARREGILKSDSPRGIWEISENRA